MKALIVTSKVCFAPDNYDGLILGLAANPHVGGLLVLDNSGLVGFRLLIKALGLSMLGARRTGLNLARNVLGRSMQRRQRAFARFGKPVWEMRTINHSEVLDLVRNQGFDLIVNARTRCIYQSAILQAPRLGCINIHHGLLPDQRGTMCDLWALARKQAAGFSVHRMTTQIDGGEIIATVTVSDGTDCDYAAYLRRASERELAELTKILDDIASRDAIISIPNVDSGNRKHDRNPTRDEISRMRRGGMRL